MDPDDADDAPEMQVVLHEDKIHIFAFCGCLIHIFGFCGCLNLIHIFGFCGNLIHILGFCVSLCCLTLWIFF
jgi:hypothetical protein